MKAGNDIYFKSGCVSTVLTMWYLQWNLFPTSFDIIYFNRDFVSIVATKWYLSLKSFHTTIEPVISLAVVF